MRLIEGKKHPYFQEKIKEQTDKIMEKVKQYHDLEDEIRFDIQKWVILVEAERGINGEEWMISDQIKLELLKRELLPKYLRK